MSVAHLDLRNLGQRLRLDRIVPGLVRTPLLHARATSPYGQFLSDAQLASLWEENGGSGEVPAWFVLGSQDIPTGTLWHVAFAPPTSQAGPQDVPELLPEGLWIRDLQAAVPSGGWCLKRTRQAGAEWIGLWEGPACLRLVRTEGTAQGQIEFMERRWSGCIGAPNLEVPWREPTRTQAAALLEAEPQAALLPETERTRRLERHSRRRALRGLAFTVGILAVVTLVLLGARIQARHRLDLAKEKTRGLAPSLERLQRLGTEHSRSVESLQARPALLRPNAALDLWLGQILSACPPARLQALQLQGSDSAAPSVRLDLEVQDWSELNPLLERLRKVPGVNAARFENQGRQDGKVRAQARLEGGVR